MKREIQILFIAIMVFWNAQMAACNPQEVEKEIHSNQSDSTTGDVCGRVYQQAVFDSCQLFIQTGDKRTQVLIDTVNQFYIANLVNGNYTLELIYPHRRTEKVWNLHVAPDSITFIEPHLFLDRYYEGVRYWIHRIKRVSLSKRGTLTGRVLAFDTNKPVKNAEVIVQGTYYRAICESQGIFIIKNIIPGNYWFAAGYEGYASDVFEVTITPDSVNNIGDYYLQSPMRETPVSPFR
jgi:hypothetical protein